MIVHVRMVYDFRKALFPVFDHFCGCDSLTCVDIVLFANFLLFLKDLINDCYIFLNIEHKNKC